MKADRELFAEAATCPDCELGNLCSEHSLEGI